MPEMTASAIRALLQGARHRKRVHGRSPWVDSLWKAGQPARQAVLAPRLVAIFSRALQRVDYLRGHWQAARSR
jgi:hypothetical protein